MKRVSAFLGCLLSAWILLPQQADFPRLTGPYLGQKPPGMIPEPFASNVFSRDFSCGGFAFSAKGDEVFFFAVNKSGHSFVMNSYLREGFWSTPQRIDGSAGNQVHPFYSHDGNKIFYGSDKRIQPDSKVPYFNLWFVERLNQGWSESKSLPGNISTGWENCGSIDDHKNLFFRRVSPRTRGDLFRAEFVNGKFDNPAKLPDEINSVYDESHPAISPDGSYIIFSSKRPWGFGRGNDELWIGFRISDSEWSSAANMESAINNGRNNSCASISRDGKFIFFVRMEKGMAVPYWVSAKIIEALRMKGKAGHEAMRIRSQDSKKRMENMERRLPISLFLRPDEIELWIRDLGAITGSFCRTASLPSGFATPTNTGWNPWLPLQRPYALSVEWVFPREHLHSF